MRSLVLLFALVACDSQTRSSPVPAPPPPPPPANPAVQAEMQSHFEAGTTVRDAIIRGDVAAAKAGFEALGGGDVPYGLPQGSQPLFEAMQGAAKQGAAASTSADQATALVATLRACGGCHAKVNARPEWDVPDAPSRDPGVRQHMARHKWAMDRMYEGVVGPTESSWAQAAAILKDHAVDEAELARGVKLTPEAKAAAERLHELGKEARAAETPELRGEKFAEALTACATCHVDVGMGPTE